MDEHDTSNPETETSTAVNETALNIKQAAEFIGISTQRMNRLRRRREIPAHRAGWRGWRFKQSDVMAYVERAAGVQGAAAAASDQPAIAPDPARTNAQDMMQLLAEFGPPADAEAPSLANEAPIVRMANAILVNGFEAGASDIHLEPDWKNVRVRLRVDGSLQMMMTMPKHLQFVLMNRYKIMADIEPFQRFSPHLGSIPVRHGERDYNVRVSAVPGHFGDSIVMHLLENAFPQRGLPSLGFTPFSQATLEDLGASTSGLLLFAGPPGSGLTTTAFALLNKINAVTAKICTLEDVAEYQLGGIEQTFRRRNRLSVTDGVGALLRHNPDVLFLGDISDEESARCAVDAALSGVLAVATISALDSIDALRRLVSLGVSRADAARAVVGVVGQRLVRKLCHDCKEEYTVSADELRRFGVSANFPDEVVALFRGRGCENCRKRGFRGRIGLFEVLAMTDEIAELFGRDAPRSDLKDALQAYGMASLLSDGVHKFRSGFTTPDEVNRALGLLTRA